MLPLDWADEAQVLRFGGENAGRFAGVLTHRERCVLPTALLAQALGVPGNDPEAIRTMQDKARCRKRLAVAGLRQPRVLDEVGDPSDAAHRVPAALGPGPWVIKPRVGMGSEGVAIVHNASELGAAIMTSSAHGPVLAEQFVAGDEFSCEGVLCNGLPVVLATTRKEIDARCVESGHRIPAGLSAGQAADVEAAVVRAFEALGITHGIFHVEFWLDGSEITLGELHARPGGDFIHALVEASRPGLELFGLLLDDLVGLPHSTIPAQSRAAGSQYLTFPSGTLRAVKGWDEATRDLVAAELLVKPGDELVPPTSSEGRHAVLVAEDVTVAAVNSLLSTAIASLEVVVQ